jgi:hypothetical protein
MTKQRTFKDHPAVDANKPSLVRREALLEELRRAMEIGNPYGISNRLIAPRGVISVKSGCLLVVRYFKAGVFPRGER